jgi:EAL domain-containing protein (putative c-di-GMP-specific phosphodiesterase class I)
VQERITPITKLLREFDIKIAATNISTKGQLKVVVELGIAHCSGDLFAPSVAHSAYSDLIQSLNIEPLLDDAPNIVSIRDFSAD